MGPLIIGIILFFLFLTCYKAYNLGNSYHLKYYILHLIINFICVIIFFVFFLGFDQLGIFDNFRDIQYMIFFVFLIQPISIILFKYHILSIASGYLKKISAFDIITYLLFALCAINILRYPIQFYDSVLIFNLKTLIPVNSPINVDFGIDISWGYISKFYILIICIITLIQINKVKFFVVKNSMKIKIWANSFISFNIVVHLIVLLSLFSIFNLNIANNELLLKTSRVIQVLLALNYALNPILLLEISKLKLGKFSSDDSKNSQRLNKLFIETKCYINPKLTIVIVSELLGLKNSEISDSIKSIKTNNFNDYVNKFRINYSIELINDNYLDNKTIESLASESGFNSVQSFHRVFKKFKSKTPNEFLKNPIKN